MRQNILHGKYLSPFLHGGRLWPPNENIEELHPSIQRLATNTSLCPCVLGYPHRCQRPVVLGINNYVSYELPLLSFVNMAGLGCSLTCRQEKAMGERRKGRVLGVIFRKSGLQIPLRLKIPTTKDRRMSFCWVKVNTLLLAFLMHLSGECGLNKQRSSLLFHFGQCLSHRLLPVAKKRFYSYSIDEMRYTTVPSARR